MNEKKFENIIWDWNGTLLDDTAICIQSMNNLLHERNLPLLTEDKYRNVFNFPVQNYYSEIGFDFSKECFDIPALQFIAHYNNYIKKAFLFPEVLEILEYYKGLKYNQYILSAMEQSSLENCVNNLNINLYFKKVAGINDHFARSKAERGLQLVHEEKLDIKKTLLIGDTIHDSEVAETIGLSCILVSQGHFTEQRLQVNGNTVIKNLIELKKYL